MNPKNLLNPAYVYKHRHGYWEYLQSRMRRIGEHALNAPVNIRYRMASYGLLLTRNERKLAALKDKHRGQRCFIIGNGPSLNKTNLRLLKNEITFGVNKIYLLFPEMGYVPTYYVVTDHRDAENNIEEIQSITGTTKLFPERLKYCLRPSPETIYFRHSDSPPGLQWFSPNALDCVYPGENVTYVDIQLAYYMGIREVYLVGTDFDWGEELNKVGNVPIVAHGEATHFCADYHKPGEVWIAPNFGQAERAFQVAKRFFEEHGGVIYNATIGGKLEVFPRVNYEEVVSSRRQ